MVIVELVATIGPDVESVLTSNTKSSSPSVTKSNVAFFVTAPDGIPFPKSITAKDPERVLSSKSSAETSPDIV